MADEFDEEVDRLWLEHKNLELRYRGLHSVLLEKERAHLDLLERLQRREQEALRLSEDRFLLLLQSAGEGILGLDGAGRISFQNEAAARMCGYQGPELIGASRHALLHARRPDGTAFPEDECPLRRAVAEGRPEQRDDQVFYRKDGTSFPVEYRVSPVREANGDLGAVLVFGDITERKRFEREQARLVRDLAESVRARDDFLSVASHELRTPLTPLRLQVHMLRRLAATGALDAKSIGPRLDLLERQIVRLGELVETLLDVSRITVGRLTLELEEVDLVQLVRSNVHELTEGPRSSAGPVAIIGERSLVGRWDRLRLGQVVSNLLTNAIKYGGGMPIEVRVTRSGALARLEVADHGIGISEADLPHIFERFQRAASVRNFTGFGVGLWIVFKMVEAHHGTVAVTSELGRGSTFTVELPLDQPG